MNTTPWHGQRRPARVGTSLGVRDGKVGKLGRDKPHDHHRQEARVGGGQRRTGAAVAEVWKIVWATLFGAVTFAALVIFLTQKHLL